jgi:uridine kinase
MIDHQALIEQISAVSLRNGRRIIAISGGPASGKSTLASKLGQSIANACVV